MSAELTHSAASSHTLKEDHSDSAASVSHHLLHSAPPFPGKIIGFTMTSTLQARLEALDAYLLYFVDNVAMGSKNVGDALRAFLEVFVDSFPRLLTRHPYLYRLFFL